MKRTRFWILSLTAALLLTLLPTTALAGTSTQYIDQNGDTKSADATPIDGTTATLSAGWYFVTGSVTHTGTITVNGDVNLILADDSSFTITGSASDAGINVSAGSLTIYGQSKGNGQLTAIGTGGGAGLGSGKDAVNGGTVNISGGTVTATGNGGGAGIGGGSGSVGCSVTIRGGTITATGIDGGAGIGGGKSGSASTVSIKGGTVTATGISGGSGIGIGEAGSTGAIIIAGGTIKSSNFGGTVLNKPAADGGEAVYLTTITLADASNTATGNAPIAQMGIQNQSYGTKDMRTDSNGKLYLFLPKDALTTAAQTTDCAATPVYTNYRGSVKTLNNGLASGTLKVGGPPVQNLNVGGKVRLTSTTLGFGQLPITNATAASTAIATAQLSSGSVTVSGISAGNTTVTVTYSNGSTEIVSIRVFATDLVVNADNPLGYSYDPGSGTLIFNTPGSYTVSMKSSVTSTTANRIKINGGTSTEPIIITLNNVKIQNGSPAFDLTNTSYVKLMMTAGTTNTMVCIGDESGIHCPLGATLVIDGPGGLTAQGGRLGAGIGGDSGDTNGTIIINGGTVTANAGSYGGAAGIGAGYYYADGGVITINGGTVTATGSEGTGYSPGAGIGGGFGGKGGNVTITGGTVTATGGSKFTDNEYDYLDKYEGGAAIGGGSEGAGGTLTVTGGSVRAIAGLHADGVGGGNGAKGTGTITNGHQALQLRVLYNVLPATNPQTVTYDIPLESGGDKISYRYTGTGHGNKDTNLYFYLPLGEFTTTTVASSKNPVNPGGSVTFTAIVVTASGNPAFSGDAAFYDGDTLLGTAVVSGGTATYTTSSLTAERHLIKVKYFGLVNQCYGSYSEVLTQRVVTEPILDVSSGSINITSGGTYRITGSTTENTITISTSAAVTVILDNVSIDFETSSYYRNPFNSGANVTLLLEGTNTFKCYPEENTSYSNNQPAVKVEGTDKLIIDNDTGGTGTLTVVGGYYMPGIGGGYKQAPGSVTIKGGTVNATGGNHGAGIGSAGMGIVSIGSVSVTGGTLSAQGGFWAAGIGGGAGNAGCTVSISGGYVTATGGTNGAGIGGGDSGAGGNVIITNGTINATGGNLGSGIGGGYRGAGGTVTITGGSIKAALGSGSAAPIGQGAYYPASGTITNGFEAVELRVVADMVAAQKPQDVTYASPVISNGNSYTYRYTGRGHGGGDTNLYFYLPKSISVGSPGGVTLTDSETGIKVSGNISEGAILTIGELTLGNDAACDTIREWMNGEDYKLLLGVNISLSGGFTGSLTVSVPVDMQYNGRAVTILHAKGDGTLETLSGIVANGKVTFTVTSLSPVAVFMQVGSGLDDIPKVGDNAPWIWYLLCGASAAGVVILTALGKKRMLYTR